MDKFLHSILHAGAHAIGHMMHEHHKQQESRREHYEGMSPFASFIYTACKELGYSFERIDPSYALFTVKRRYLESTLENDEFRVSAGSQFYFSSRPPAVLDQILEIRNSSLKYGFWKIVHLKSQYVLIYFIKVDRDHVNSGTFQTACNYAVEEVNDFEAVLQRQGFRLG